MSTKQSDLSNENILAAIAWTLCLAFVQLTGRESPRDMEVCLRSPGAKLYRMGFCERISWNTLAHVIETRNRRIFADFARVLIAEAR